MTSDLEIVNLITLTQHARGAHARNVLPAPAARTTLAPINRRSVVKTYGRRSPKACPLSLEPSLELLLVQKPQASVVCNFPESIDLNGSKVVFDRELVEQVFHQN